MCMQKQSTRFSQQQKSRAELKDYSTWHVLLLPIEHCASLTLCRLLGLIANFIKLLKLSCRDHKTVSLHLGLHIGYKDYVCLLTYWINCIFRTATNVHIYLFTVSVVINKT